MYVARWYPMQGRISLAVGAIVSLVALFSPEPTSAIRHWFTDENRLLVKNEMLQASVSVNSFCDPAERDSDVIVHLRFLSGVNFEVGNDPTYLRIIHTEIAPVVRSICGEVVDLVILNFFPRPLRNGRGAEIPASRATFRNLLVDDYPPKVLWVWFDAILAGGFPPANSESFGDSSLTTERAILSWLSKGSLDQLAAEFKNDQAARDRRIAVPVSDQDAVDLDLSGWWKGSTTCPLGTVFYAIEINKSTGTVTHGGYGPDKKFPLEISVRISFTKGWEGIWARFAPLDSEYDGPFETLSALVSSDQRGMTIRPRQGIGDCSGFRLTRSSLPPASLTSAQETSLGPPENREPTEREMLAALKAALQGGAPSLEVNNPIAGISVNITGFEKLGCVKANGRPGYTCDFLVETGTQVRSNEGTEAGRRHAEAVQQLLSLIGSMSNAPSHTSSSGRFLYVKGRSAWIMLKDE